MAWFRRRQDRNHGWDAAQEGKELLDQYHPRASMSDGDRFVVAPGKVLENVTLAMERVDLDIDTAISIEEDVASHDEVLSLIDELRMGPTLAIHVVNTAMRIMSARYPSELVGAALPPVYDLRKIAPQLTLSDAEHDAAKSIFNRRTASVEDLTEEDISAELASLDVPEQMAVFIALFCMYGTKVGAMKSRTGIE